MACDLHFDERRNGAGCRDTDREASPCENREDCYNCRAEEEDCNAGESTRTSPCSCPKKWATDDGRSALVG